MTDSPYGICWLFAIMFAFCQIRLVVPMTLREKYEDSLSEDIRGQVKNEGGHVDLVIDIVYNRCLILIGDIVTSMSGKGINIFGMISPSRNKDNIIFNRKS